MTTREQRPAKTCALVCLVALTATAVLPPAPGQARPVEGARSTLRGLHPLAKTADLVYETRLHYAGQIWATVTNHGIHGTTGANRVNRRDLEALRIDYSPSLEFPAGTRNDFLYLGGLWVGGIIGADTLVTIQVNGESADRDEWSSTDTVRESSRMRGSAYYRPEAKGEQEYYASFSDTLVLSSTDDLEGRLHRPLHVVVSQTSYAWSDRFSQQFVIVQCWIKNVGSRAINGMACGVFLDADVFNDRAVGEGFLDDVSGFLSGGPNLNVSTFRDTLNVAFVGDNDGDPLGGAFPLFSPRGLIGVRILHSFPAEGVNFNWWVGGGSSQNWGPVKAGARAPTPDGKLGAPVGDRNMYYLMTNDEQDYGQLLSSVDFTAQGWRPPLGAAGCDFANGIDTREVLSVGPALEPLMPGDSVPFVYAFCGGNNVYTDPRLEFNCRLPYEFTQNMNFGDLVTAASWASWIYDSPGLDSDPNDGNPYRGESHLAKKDGSPCDTLDCDTTYYTGDLGPAPRTGERFGNYGGLPDLAGPAAPSCPQAGSEFTVESRPSEIIISWNGRFTETYRDPLSKEYDFEGYRLYVSRINSSDQYSMIASWDLVDFKRYVYDPEPPGKWVLTGSPMTLDSLRVLYGDGFNPMLYTRPTTDTACYTRSSADTTCGCFRDSIGPVGAKIERCSYFAPQDFNRGNSYKENGVEQPNKILRVGDSTIVDEEGELTFGLYEAHLTGLNPSIALYVSVTAFDYGNSKIQLDPLESLPGSCYEYAIPINSAEVVDSLGLKVSVYPNPYKVSYEGPGGHRTSYFEQGFEAPEKEALIEQDRRIWFINLPSKATIRIYTLDGDLVRTIEHLWPKREGTAFLTDYSSRAAWDLVTRNTQSAVSGIYIYRIDSPLGSQVGKIVVIK